MHLAAITIALCQETVMLMSANPQCYDCFLGIVLHLKHIWLRNSLKLSEKQLNRLFLMQRTQTASDIDFFFYPYVCVAA